MFGYFRLIAALLVVVTHIGGVPFIAGAAVWGFFMLSGLLMAAALNSRYGLDAKGVSCFLQSRARRLFPTYWLCLLLTSLLLWAADQPENAVQVNSALKFPDTPGEWAANLLIVGQTMFGIGRTEASLSPSSWAVDVEILMYFCSCIFLARSLRIAIVTLALLGAAFPVLWWLARGWVQVGDMSLASQLLYSFLPAALLPYTIGTVMWFMRDRFKDMGIAWLSAGVIGVFICTAIVHPHSVTMAYLLVLPCLVVILGSLMHWTAPKRVKEWDRMAGLMSYPLYLMHWTCAYAVVLALPSEWGWVSLNDGHYAYSLPAFMCVMVLALLFSFLAAWLIEGPLDRRRHIWLKTRTLSNAT